MRILLTSNASYLPPRGGSTRSNLAFLQALAERGHEVRVVAAAAESATAQQQAQLHDELLQQQIDASRKSLDGIDVVSVPDFLRQVRVLCEQIRDFEPDWVLVSSEDLSHSLLREAARCAPGRLIYLAHTPQFFPFGPASWHADAEGAQAVRSAAAVVVISESVKRYVELHLGVQAVVVPPPIYGAAPYSTLANFDSGAVAMINPCAVKGIALFLAIADSLPDCSFAALPGWGTTSQDSAALLARKNIVVMPRVRRIEQFLQRVKVLLMPSLWLEGFGLIVMEAMLRGVPVIASDSGGLREAKAGTGFLIPVQLIDRYQPVFDEHFMPKPILPPQSTAPWIAAIHDLTASRTRYDQEVHQQKQAAEKFVSGIDRFQLEKLLLNLHPLLTAQPAPSRDKLTELSEARRQLLLRRLKTRQTTV